MKMRAVFGVVFLCLLAACAKVRCPSFGLGGDSELNRLKNRSVPPDTLREIQAEEFLKEFTPDMHTPKEHDEFTQEQRDSIEPKERLGVSLVGYLVQAFDAFPELSNCLDPEDRDWHLNISAVKPDSQAQADTLVPHAIVTEITPIWQDIKKKWTLDTLKALSHQFARMRISGWVMYDPEHPDHLGKLRGTLWEIHPITRIEVWRESTWVDLEPPSPNPVAKR